MLPRFSGAQEPVAYYKDFLLTLVLAKKRNPTLPDTTVTDCVLEQVLTALREAAYDRT